MEKPCLDINEWYQNMLKAFMAPKLSTQIFCLFERERERERGGQYITIYSVYLHLERGKRKEWGEKKW